MDLSEAIVKRIVGGNGDRGREFLLLDSCCSWVALLVSTVQIGPTKETWCWARYGRRGCSGRCYPASVTISHSVLMITSGWSASAQALTLGRGLATVWGVADGESFLLLSLC